MERAWTSAEQRFLSKGLSAADMVEPGVHHVGMCGEGVLQSTGVVPGGVAGVHTRGVMST